MDALTTYLPYLIPVASVLLVALWDWLKTRYDWLPARPDSAAVTALIADMLKDGRIDGADIPTLMAFIEQLKGSGVAPTDKPIDIALLNKLAAAYKAAKYPDPGPPVGRSL